MMVNINKKQIPEFFHLFFNYWSFKMFRVLNEHIFSIIIYYILLNYQNYHMTIIVEIDLE